MDRETRGKIEKATQRARKLLEQEFSAQLSGTYDVLLLASGDLPEKGGNHLSPREHLLRDKIVAAVRHKQAAGMQLPDAVTDYLRDIAFTTLNRFVALKMLEARELVQECISRGDQSSGYREFCGLVPALPLLADDRGYHLYIESVFDELSQEIKVLFDRRDVATLVWPRRQALHELLEVLNDSELASVWHKDETIGWVYQYFNTGDERREMRGQSQAPRNSRELAIRNQFFTPRYVVQFLTDNTLGRIWYEMREGQTNLIQRCKYLVHRPGETFAPRAKKDPRDLRILDPACGSGHFLLYAFELLLTIYHEGWTDSEAPRSEVTGRTLREDFPSRERLEMELPGLLLRHNLHGVDIDPRCAQIAQLALWMRAQRAFSDFRISRSDRPVIQRANVVIAEPMPGEADLQAEFISRLGDRALADHFNLLIEHMKLAGELGLLLRIEQFVKSVAKKGETGSLFQPPAERILAALERFVEAAATSQQARCRMFRDDAEQGLGLVKLTQQRFDVTLMNPPFGDSTSVGRNFLKDSYQQSGNDLYSAFVARAIELRTESGLIGAITSRTGFFASSLDEWRNRLYESGLFLFADLGERVMDSATVEAGVYCLGSTAEPLVIRLLTEPNKESALQSSVELLSQGKRPDHVYIPSMQAIARLRNKPFAYWTTLTMVDQLSKWPTYEPGKGAVRKGLRTGENFRFVRTMWEVSTSAINTSATDSSIAHGWIPLVMTGASQPWFAPIFLTVNWLNAGRELRTFVLKHGVESRLIQGKDFYFLPGFSWTLRAVRLFPYGVARGCIFTGSRPMAFPSSEIGAKATLGLFASRCVSAFIRFYAEWFSRPKFAEGHLKNVPIPSLSDGLRQDLELAVDQGVERARAAYQRHEPFSEFTIPRFELVPQPEDRLSFEPTALLGKDLEEKVAEAYGLSASDARRMQKDLDEALAFAGWANEDHFDEGDDESSEDAVVLIDGREERAWRLISYAVGCSFGRWDIRFATGDSNPSPMAKVDDALPTKPRGALLGGDGTFPVDSVPANYPISIALDGILVVDEGHSDDIGGRVAAIFDLLPTKAEAIYLALDLKDAHFGSSSWRNFFLWHVKTYSLGRRKAPIYWQLAVPSARYSIWLYYHRFTKDTFFQVADLVKDKLQHEERKLDGLRSDYGSSPNAAQRKELASQEQLVTELRAFRDEVARVAPLWNPNLDDGVIINFALLWRLVPHHRTWQKECKDYWDKLCSGAYDWSHLAMHLWPERVVPKCHTDRSLAIAHGLEDEFWFEDEKNCKWYPRTVSTHRMAELVDQRSSPAVKAALDSLLSEPVTAASGKRGTRKGKKD